MARVKGGLGAKKRHNRTLITIIFVGKKESRGNTSHSRKRIV